MAVTKSFQEILNDKLNLQKKPAENLQRVDQYPWWNLGTLNKPVAETEPAAYSAHELKKPRETQTWSVIEEMAIREMIHLGAKLYLNSSAQDIKSEYHRLLGEFHPDRHHGKDEITIRRYTKLLRQLIHSYRPFKPARNVAA